MNAQLTMAAAAQMLFVTTTLEASLVHARQDTPETEFLVPVKRYSDTELFI